MQGKILFSRSRIAERVASLGAEISGFYKDTSLTVVVLMNGGLYFAADLTRCLSCPDLKLDSMAVASYVGQTRGDDFVFRGKLKLPVRGSNILLVDDIADSGITLNTVKKYLLREGAVSVKTCVLLKKELSSGSRPPEWDPDWFAFSVPDVYVFGYGLDSFELGRNLPDIYADC